MQSSHQWMLTIAVLVSLLALPQRAFTQLDVSIEPVSALFKVLVISADYSISESVSLEGRIAWSETGQEYPGTPEAKGMGITGLAKYYFEPQRGTDRFYTDIWLNYVSASYNTPNMDGSSDNSQLSLGFGIGYKLIAGNKILFDFGAGVGRVIANPQDDFAITGIFNISLGYRFGGK